MTAANRQPAAASYRRAPGTAEYHLAALHVLRVERGQIVELTTFAPSPLRGFDLPATLSDR